MSHLPQDLHNLFPAATEQLRTLKETNRHFLALADRYGAIDDQLRHSEAGTGPAMDDMMAEDLKKERLAVLDQIAVMLEEEKA